MLSNIQYLKNNISIPLQYERRRKKLNYLSVFLLKLTKNKITFHQNKVKITTCFRYSSSHLHNYQLNHPFLSAMGYDVLVPLYQSLKIYEHDHERT